MFGSIGAGGQLAFDSSICQTSCIGCHTVDSINALIEVVFDFVKIAVVIIGNCRRNIALGNSVHIFGSYVQRPDDGIQCLIDSGDDLLEITLVFGCIGAGSQFAF